MGSPHRTPPFYKLYDVPPTEVGKARRLGTDLIEEIAILRVFLRSYMARRAPKPDPREVGDLVRTIAQAIQVQTRLAGQSPEEMLKKVGAATDKLAGILGPLEEREEVA